MKIGARWALHRLEKALASEPAGLYVSVLRGAAQECLTLLRLVVRQDDGEGVVVTLKEQAPPKTGPFSIGSTIWPGLSKLVEEMGETAQVIGKLMGTGGETAHWDGSDLRLRLIEETADVAAAIDFVTRLNTLATPEWEERRQKKLALFMQWHQAQGAGK